LSLRNLTLVSFRFKIVGGSWWANPFWRNSMSRISIAGRPHWTVAMLVASFLLASSRSHAQQPAPEPVNIITADAVKLKAVFYPSSMKGAPTVIMLHPIGEGNGMKAPEWKNLAESLQKANFSVIMFDFRGHGDSTTID